MQNHRSRKIPRQYENPIDNVLIDLSDKISPTLNRYQITPNMVTILGNLIRVGAVYALFNGNKSLFFLGAITSYFLDCLDGHLARKYKQCTKFGDYLDHIGDLGFHGILLYYLLVVSTLRDSRYVFIIIFVLITLILLMCSHLGCQELCYKCEGDNCSDTLYYLKNMCNDKKGINVTRYFGCGTLILFLYLICFRY